MLTSASINNCIRLTSVSVSRSSLGLKGILKGLKGIAPAAYTSNNKQAKLAIESGQANLYSQFSILKKISANVLFVGGTTYTNEFYSADGYEFMRDFLLNEYEFGNFTESQVLINDDFNPAANSISAQV